MKARSINRWIGGFGGTIQPVYMGSCYCSEVTEGKTKHRLNTEREKYGQLNRTWRTNVGDRCPVLCAGRSRRARVAFLGLKIYWGDNKDR